MTVFGPRAIITRIGAAEPIDEGRWWLSGWSFVCHHTPCPVPVTYDDDGHPTAVFGWSLDDLRALSAAEFELAGLPSEERRR